MQPDRRRDGAPSKEVVMPMTDATTPHRAPKPKPKPDKASLVADDVVTTNSLATHLGMTRQNVARLVSEAVLVQRSDGCFDQTANRLRYIKHLREQHRHTPRSAADTEHLKAKTEMLQMRLAEKRKELVRQEDVDALIEDICGEMLTAMSSMPAQCAPIGDLATRRRFEKWVFETRTKIADAARQKADEYGEPPLSEQG
jgi:hypothetical protein